METLVLLEYDARTEHLRQDLLDRIGVLALADEGWVHFIATEGDDGAPPLREIIAVGFARPDAAEKVLARWQAEGVLTEVSLRRLQVEPMQLAEPVAPIFP